MDDVKIAYLMNTYPMTSTTFIRREIHALERRGVEVVRYAVREWSEHLVDPLDLAEREQTDYLLSGNVLALVQALLVEAVTNTRGLMRAIRTWARLTARARGGVVQHIAYLLQAIYLRRRAERDGIGHIHVHFSTNATAVALMARRLGGPTYSFTVHGPDELDAMQQHSIGMKIANASFVAAISHYCKSQLIRGSKPDYWSKIHVLRCGINLHEFERRPVRPESQTFVCVGRLCDQKGQLLLPGVVAALRHDFPRLRLILLGDGETREALEAAIVDHGVEDMITIHGWATNAEVRELIASSRALVLPSFAEGLPVVFMEAFALERPVIATYIAGIPELVDDTCGWIVPAADQRALEHALRAALTASAEELDAKGRAGRLRVEAAHDLDAIAVEFEKHFVEALNVDP